MFRLLDLPDELWLKICKMAVTYDEILCVNYRPKTISGNEVPTGIFFPGQPSVTRVSRSLRAETLDYFYSDNVFHGTNWPSRSGLCALHWALKVAPANLKSLRHFYVSSSLSHVSSLPKEWNKVWAVPPSHQSVWPVSMEPAHGQIYWRLTGRKAHERAADYKVLFRS